MLADLLPPPPGPPVGNLMLAGDDDAVNTDGLCQVKPCC